MLTQWRCHSTSEPLQHWQRLNGMRAPIKKTCFKCGIWEEWKKITTAWHYCSEFQKFHTMWNTNQYFSLSQHTQNTHKTLLVFKIQADKSTNFNSQYLSIKCKGYLRYLSGKIPNSIKPQREEETAVRERFLSHDL